ncbi:hypothetical protein ACRAWD_27195 [Caulobacter segnis]
MALARHLNHLGHDHAVATATRQLRRTFSRVGFPTQRLTTRRSRAARRGGPDWRRLLRARSRGAGRRHRAGAGAADPTAAGQAADDRWPPAPVCIPTWKIAHEPRPRRHRPARPSERRRHRPQRPDHRPHLRRAFETAIANAARDLFLWTRRSVRPGARRSRCDRPMDQPG